MSLLRVTSPLEVGRRPWWHQRPLAECSSGNPPFLANPQTTAKRVLPLKKSRICSGTDGPTSVPPNLLGGGRQEPLTPAANQRRGSGLPAKP